MRDQPTSSPSSDAESRRPARSRASVVHSVNERIARQIGRQYSTKASKIALGGGRMNGRDVEDATGGFPEDEQADGEQPGRQS